MYTYVQRRGYKKENTSMYVHTGGISNAYSRIRTARARVHGEATKCVVFIGRQRNTWEPTGWAERNAWSCSSGGLGRNRRWKRGLAYRRTEETALCSTGHVRNGILFIGRGVAYRKTEETDLLRSKRGPIDREGCGVPQNGGYGLVLERYGRNGVLFIRRGVAYRKTGLHGILFISIVDLLQPPWATIHSPSTFSSLHLLLFIHRRLPLASTS